MPGGLQYDVAFMVASQIAGKSWFSSFDCLHPTGTLDVTLAIVVFITKCSVLLEVFMYLSYIHPLHCTIHMYTGKAGRTLVYFKVY